MSGAVRQFSTKVSIALRTNVTCEHLGSSVTLLLDLECYCQAVRMERRAPSRRAEADARHLVEVRNGSKLGVGELRTLDVQTHAGKSGPGRTLGPGAENTSRPDGGITHCRCWTDSEWQAC